jgi:hypothetical protein
MGTAARLRHYEPPRAQAGERSGDGGRADTELGSERTNRWQRGAGLDCLFLYPLLNARNDLRRAASRNSILCQGSSDNCIVTDV